MTRYLAWLGRLALSIALLALLFRVIDVPAFVAMVGRLSAGLYLAGVALFFASISLGTVRWQMLLRAAGDRIGFWRLLGINLVGGFFSMFLPTAVGGDVARMYEIAEDAHGGARAVSTVVFDRLVGMLSIILVGVSATAFGYRAVGSETVAFVVTIAVSLGIGCWLFFEERLVRRAADAAMRLPFVARLEANARGMYRAMQDLGRERMLVAQTVAISVVVQVTEIVSAIAIARALGLAVPAAYFFVFMPIVWVVTMVPFSLNGLGVREGAFVFLLQRVGSTAAQAVGLSLLTYSCRIVIAVAGGLVFLGRSKR